ncbi:type VI secretion system-associated FHA domain protein TagH [Pseudomonas sp. ME-P-057]|uniref:type VI secretion system-associated FHA domain protein TagH n=1 Tax=Pseudomonas sp. ME-P-057 TaxID=3040321 RepID=UPI0025523FAB|nr:type VI secretion system-associated FHA domain protein TagH [Pseudomonas sp. ME-P-057]
MPMKLRIDSYQGQSPESEVFCLIDERGTLGRAADNDLLLSDPGKYISRRHARIEWREGGYYLMDVGSNPSVVNERLLGNGRETPLRHGDELVIGDYRIAVSVLDQPSNGVPQSDITSGISATQTLAVFTPPAGVGPEPLAVLRTQPALPAVHIHAGFHQPDVPVDALADASILRGPARVEPVSVPADPLGLGWLAGSVPAGHGEPLQVKDTQQLLPSFRGAESDHLSPEQQALPLALGPQVPPLGLGLIPDRYDALADLLAPMRPSFAGDKPGDAQAQAPVTATEVEAAGPPPPAAAEAAVVADMGVQMPGRDAIQGTRRQASQLSQPAASSDVVPANDSVLRALLHGLGVPDLRTSRSPEALAQLVGEMLREATGGTMAVLMARALTKRESHIDMTMIGARSNNPLKFFPDAASALSQMLSTDAPAYLPGVQALTAAFDDLKAHELAVIAGMREALSEVAQRISPALMEERMPGRPFDGLLPSARKARLWERFNELYGELVRDGEEDLHRMFGDTFSQAYQQQVARLRATP